MERTKSFCELILLEVYVEGLYLDTMSPQYFAVPLNIGERTRTLLYLGSMFHNHAFIGLEINRILSYQYLPSSLTVV